MSIERAIQALKAKECFHDDIFAVTHGVESSVYCCGERIVNISQGYIGVTAYVSENPIIREATGKAWELIWGSRPVHL